MMGRSLRRLMIDKPTIPIIGSILKNCSYLETLDIKISSTILTSVLQDFKKLNIKNLNITSSSDCRDCIFKNLAKNLSSNVKVVSFVILNLIILNNFWIMFIVI
jgi:hypothetical protein